MAFKIDPQAALEGAKQAELSAVVVIGQFSNGRLAVFSSESTPKTLDLIDRAQPHIESLRDDQAA